MSKRKKIVICGATGFIGRNCAERFAADPAFEVIGIHHRRPPFNHHAIAWIEADLTRTEDAMRAIDGADIVIQAAATTSGAGDIVARPHTHITDTAIIHNQVFRAAHEWNVEHLVIFSCSVMYPSREEPHDESSFDANAEIYPRYFAGAWNKIYFEKLGEFFASISDTKVSVIRHTNVYGPHDKYDLAKSHVFGATVTKVMTMSDKVVVWGSGEESRDLIHVDDLVDLIELMIEKQDIPYDLVCAGAGYAISIRELVGKIIDASGKMLVIEHDLDKPTIPTSVSLSFARASERYGWTPKVDLETGIARTLDWWRRTFEQTGDPVERPQG
jgi:GDP-L-fucose synthase